MHSPLSERPHDMSNFPVDAHASGICLMQQGGPTHASSTPPIQTYSVYDNRPCFCSWQHGRREIDKAAKIFGIPTTPIQRWLCSCSAEHSTALEQFRTLVFRKTRRLSTGCGVENCRVYLAGFCMGPLASSCWETHQQGHHLCQQHQNSPMTAAWTLKSPLRCKSRT